MSRVSVMTLIRVDFPAPFGPMMLRISPGAHLERHPTKNLQRPERLLHLEDVAQYLARARDRV